MMSESASVNKIASRVKVKSETQGFCYYNLIPSDRYRHMFAMKNNDV